MKRTLRSILMFAMVMVTPAMLAGPALAPGKTLSHHQAACVGSDP